MLHFLKRRVLCHKLTGFVCAIFVAWLIPIILPVRTVKGQERVYPKRTSQTAHPTTVTGAIASKQNSTGLTNSTDVAVKLEGVQKVDLNTATLDDLVKLPGIGPSKAKRIIDWRIKNKGFQRVSQLLGVPGFGRKTVTRLAPLLAVTKR